MDEIAIRVENLGKRYRLRTSTRQPRYRTLRDEIMHLPKHLWAAFKTNPKEEEEFWALRNVSFEVKRGEVLGVIGRNGAGKSTLLKILSRIVDPSEGAVDIFGRVGSLLEVGTGFHPELTGRENIYLSGAMLGMRRLEVRARLDEIVAFAEVEKFLDTPCKHYSSGMFLRLGFAVAAHLEAAILLVDEVLAVGDVEFQRKCLNKMGQVSRGGRTILLVSHDLDVIRRLASYCIWVDGGMLCQAGPTNRVVDAYLNASLWRDNQASGRASFQKDNRNIWFSGACVDGIGGNKISMGGTLVLVFEVNANPAFARTPVCFAIGLRTEDGMAVSLVADVDSGFRVGEGVGNSMQISVTFKKLMLYPGRYFIRLWAGSPDGIETYDDRQDCLILFVTDGGQLSQRRLLRSQGVCFFQPDWTIKPQSSSLD